MPLGEQEGLLIGAGVSLSLATTYFYRQRQTLPFKWAHFLAWPVLGTGILLALSPSHDQMADTLRKSGLAGADCEAREAAAAAAAAEWRPDPETDLVLSDVHIGRAPSATQRCTTVFRFRPGWVPPGRDAGGSADLSGGSPDGVSSHSSCDSRDSPQPAAALPHSRAAPAQLDEDGDVVVKRRRRSADGDTAGAAEGRLGSGTAGGIVMHHAMATSLHGVGKQVWRGSLLLADLLLGCPQLVVTRTVAELGAGCGLAGVAAARAGARRVLATDLPPLLPQLQENVVANAASFPAGGASATAHRLDWAALPPVTQQHVGHRPAAGGRHAACALQQWAATHGWSPADLRNLLQAKVVLAADTVYDDDITDAFMAAAAALLQPHAGCADEDCPICRPLGSQQGLCTEAGSSGGSGVGGGNGGGSGKRMFVALEKRYNFTLRHMDARASAYEHWLELFNNTPQRSQPLGDAEAGSATPGKLAGVTPARGVNTDTSAYSSPRSCATARGVAPAGPAKLPLAGKRLNLASVQQVLEYDRGNDLELWELWAEA